VQSLQIETGGRVGSRTTPRPFPHQGRDQNGLFAVRQRNYRTLQADTGQTSFLPRVLPAAATGSYSLIGQEWLLERQREHADAAQSRTIGRLASLPPGLPT